MRRVAVASLVLSLLAASCATGSNRDTVIPDIPVSLAPTESTIPQAELTCRVGFGTGRGAEVIEIVAGVPAASVLEPGDVVVSVDGAPISDSTQLVAAIQTRGIGDTIDIEADRAGTTIAGEVELVERADSPGTAMAGISIRTAVDLRPAEGLATVPAPTITGAAARVVELEGRLLAFDPLVGEWETVADVAPAEPWAAVDGEVYALAEDGSSQLVAVLGDQSIAIPPGPWIPRWVIGSMGPDLLVLGEQGTGDGYSAAILAVDAATGDIAWEWSPGTQDGLPLVPLLSLPDPTQTQSLIVLAAMSSLSADPESLSLAVIDHGGEPITVATPASGELPAQAVAIGWHDAKRIAYLPAERDRVLVWDITSGSVEEVEVPRISTASELLPVGDGTHFIMQTGTGIDLVSPSTVRPLAVDCVPDRISGLGFGS
jgi:PDZ domain